MDRVTDFESGGWGFDSRWGRRRVTGGFTYNSARFLFNLSGDDDRLGHDFRLVSRHGAVDQVTVARIDHRRANDKRKSTEDLFCSAFFI